MTGFRVLFSVVIHHDFFESGFCNDINVEPSRATLAQAKNSGIIFKPCLGGLLVLCDAEKIPILQLYIEDEGLAFDFYITSSDPYLSNYSSIALMKDKQMLWLKHDLNQGGNALNGIDKYQLHSSGWISDDDYYSKDKVSDYFERETLDFSAKTFMFISIKLNEQDLNSLTANDIDSSGFVVFYAAVNNKSSFWEYRLHGKNIKSSLEISDRDKDIEFNFISNELLNDGRNITVFRSSKEIKLKEFSECYFQLIDKRTNGHRVLIKRLPVAHFNHGYQEVVDTKLAQISEIFVNF
ncbi:hypothetical protein Sps_04525 [Shewanella psychrophila]|uniref:Uncharacterized protein n=1 Tax=Shewanella psychrophila TaxID=225848 RepID=A0A1S6HVL1_9GAMM|nr:hypothetical protein [Shewanella psychrophila]AQS39610.1 hypothetical protein Sps_04525 [Shewanella psychrophila]